MNEPMRSYKDLIVWQKSIKLVKTIYELTDNFPKSELFGLTSQMRRAAVSIPSNIAEGRHRGTRKDYTHFLRIAYASAMELETQLIISRELNFSKISKYEKSNNLLHEIILMLNTMLAKLRTCKP